MAKEVLLINHIHFDPTWRRCFDRPAVYNGMVMRSYADLEEAMINKWLEMAPEGYTFNEGQAALWRKYLERNPDKKELLQKYAKDGTLDVMLAGEVVQDNTMPAAEGLVRNYLVAMPFYRDLVGEDHPALKLAWQEDAFGNNPNMPQILRGVGAEVACRLSYQKIEEPVWVGIDGSAILCNDTVPHLGGGMFEKHPPCPECHGEGCEACDNTGIKILDTYDFEQIRDTLRQAAASENEWMPVFINTEELLPHHGFIDVLKELNEEYAGTCTFRWTNQLEVNDRYMPEMQEYAAKHDGTPTRDLNPAMPGCYVSRIKCKQRVRKISYKLVAAEARHANAAWQAGSPSALPAEFTTAWRNVAFNHFHDAITGTHIDNAYRELQDMLDEAEQIADSHLCQENVPASSDKFEELHQKTTRQFGKLNVTFDKLGILAIETDGKNIFGKLPPANANGRPLRIGELTVEPDFGDAWGTRIPVDMQLGFEFHFVGLGKYNQVVEASNTAIRWRGAYNGGDPMIKKLSWTTTASISANGTRLDFVTEVDWDTASRRLRLYVPIESDKDTATWEVPYGFIDRKYEPDKINHSQWRSNTMEFPALHWVCHETDDGRGVMLLNKGLPCYRWRPGKLDLSLVRSPQWQFCVMEPGNYEFWDFDGLRDTGRHRFEYAILPCANSPSKGDLTRIGYEYNMPQPIELPFEVSGDVAVTAWKPAESGEGWILRLQEAGGRGTTVELKFDSSVKVTETNLIEKPQSESEQGATFDKTLHKHGIMTLLIQQA